MKKNRIDILIAVLGSLVIGIVLKYLGVSLDIVFLTSIINYWVYLIYASINKGY